MKNKRCNVIVSVTAVLLMSAIASMSLAQEQTFRIGMSSDDVRRAMGRPDHQSSRSVEESKEQAWLYLVEAGSGILYCEYHTFWFRDGVMLDITTRTGGAGERCESFGRVSRPRIDWGEMPE